MVENKEKGGSEKTRLVEKMGELVLVGLIGKHKGDIAETPGFKKGNLTKLAEVPRYRLFHGEISGCYLMISQGKEIVDPEKIIITCFGKEEKQINQTLDNFLKETNIQEVNATEELRANLEKAKLLDALGVLPEWLRSPN